MKKLILPVFFLLSVVTTLFAQPSTLSLQGVLRDQSGAAVADGNYTLVFNIYSAAAGGSSIWNETQNSIPVVNGVFSVRLGSVTSFGSLNFTQQYWVGIRVGSSGATELSPRIELTAVPYAFALKGGENVLAGSGNVGIGTLSPSQKLHVNGNARVDGNMGVGTNSTTYRLDVSGNSNVTGDLRVTGNLNAGSITGPNSTVSISGNMNMSGQLNGAPNVFGKWEDTNFHDVLTTGTFAPIREAFNFTAEADMLVMVYITFNGGGTNTFNAFSGEGNKVFQQEFTGSSGSFMFPVKKGQLILVNYTNSTRTGFAVMRRLNIGRF